MFIRELALGFGWDVRTDRKGVDGGSETGGDNGSVGGLVAGFHDPALSGQFPDILGNGRVTNDVCISV